MTCKITFFHLLLLPCSLVLPLGLPLVDEGVHALLAVMQREGPVEDPLLRVQTLFQRGLVPEQRMILDFFLSDSISNYFY